MWTAARRLAASPVATCVQRRELSSSGGSIERFTRSTAGAPIRRASDRELWVSYADDATIRNRLVTVAQQVLEGVTSEPPPSLVIPERVRHGFWFMRFAQTAQRDDALQQLNGQPFTSNCGTLEGTLHVEHGKMESDLRAMLHVEAETVGRMREWVHDRFRKFGAIDDVRMPRGRSNWDSGMAWVRFQRYEDAEQALEALDGTAGPLHGCNMFIDFAVERKLVDLRPIETVG